MSWDNVHEVANSYCCRFGGNILGCDTHIDNLKNAIYDYKRSILEAEILIEKLERKKYVLRREYK